MQNLEFGVFDECSYHWFDFVSEAVDAYEQSFREVLLEERLGFKYHFVIEHQGHPVGQIQTPSVYLAALARRTSTIRIGAMVYPLPFYNPLRLAMDCAMVDQLSHGRLEFGAGFGSTDFEFYSWNPPYSFAERRQAGPEALDVIDKAWTEDRFTYHGKYYSYDDVVPLPHPFQKPHPPMWFAGRSKSSIELCVERRFGIGMFALLDHQVADLLDGWRQMLKDAGHKGPRPPSFLTRSVYVAETDEQAYEEAAPHLPLAYTWGRHKFAVPEVDETKKEAVSPTRKLQMAAGAGLTSGIDYWLENNLAYVGSPETVIRRIEESQKLTGYNVFGGRFRFGPLADHLVENSIRLFGEKVIPAFADVPAAAPTD